MNRAWLVAMAITALMLMGAMAVATNVEAATPSTGKLTLQITYTVNGTQVGVANASETTTVSYANGVQVSSGTGSSPVFKLNYGTYVVTQSPIVVPVPGHGKSIANGKTETITINSAAQTQDISIPVNVTHIVKLSVKGIPLGETANAYFLTNSRFQFLGPLTVESNKTYNVSLPFGHVQSYVKYAGATYTFSGLDSSNTALTFSLKTSTGTFGFVQASDGSQISGVTAVLLNDTTGHYTVSKFAGNYFTLYTSSSNWNGLTLILSAKGYAPYIDSSVTPGQQLQNIVLKPDSSTILYSYNLSASMHTLDLKITYNLGPGTTVPQLPNSTVNSLYEQSLLDGFSSSYLNPFFNALALNYTNSTILIAGTSYELAGAPSVSVSSTASSPSGYLNATVTATYTNSTVNPAKLTSGYKVKLYAMGRTYAPGALYTNYSFAYNNKTLALSTSSVTVKSHVSPIIIPGQSSTTWVTLGLGTVKSPKFYNTQIKLYWSGIASDSYLLNSSNHPAFIVPVNTPVYFNMSDAFYNPVTGSYVYLPPTSFSWKVNGVSAGTGYNFSHVFTALNNTVRVTGNSNTGNATNTFFTVYAYNGTPTLNYSISYNNKVRFNGTATSGTVNISVPQSAIITFSMYNSTILIPQTHNMSVPLLYNWTFGNNTYTSPNVTHIFKKPSIALSNQTGNVTVKGLTGGSKKIVFNVYVNDTTPPTAKITLLSKGKTTANPIAGQSVNLSASKSTDPYYSNTSALQYRWSFHYPNGTAISSSAGVFKVVYNNLNDTQVGVVFNTLNTVVAELNVTNPSGVSGYLNRSLTMLVSSPRIVVNGIYIPNSLQQGKTSTIYVNVSNKGTVDAASFTIAVEINGAVKANQSYNTPLNKSQYRNLSFTWTPSTSGSISVQFVGYNTSEPGFFANLGGYTKTVSISAPGYKTPLIAGGIVAVIVIVGIVYWRLSTGGLSRKSGTGKTKEAGKSKVSLPSEQKKLEKKK